MSATYWTLPVTFSGPSGRGIDNPTPFTSRVVFITLAMPLSFHAARGLCDRLDHFGVARAAAQIAGDRVANVLLGRLRVLGEQRRRGHENTRNAEAALGHAAAHEGVLQRRQRAAARQPFDRRHRAAARLHRQYEAARDQLTVEVHRACAAVAGAAALLGTREAE